MGSRGSGTRVWPDAVRAEIPGVEISGVPTGGWALFLDCEKCGRKIEAFRTMRQFPPHVIFSKLKRAGWSLGRHTICPDKHERPEPMPNLKTPDPLAATMLPPAPPAPPPSTDAAKAAKRDAMRWLDEAFNPSTGTFTATGVNDASIAKETGLAVEAVVALREEFFGPLKVPSELQAALGELARIEDDFDRFNSEMASNAAAYRTRLQDVRARIDALATKNGWRS